MSKLYQYNLLLLRFNNPETEKQYNLSCFKEDLNSLRFVIILGTTLSILFIFVDISRYKLDIISIGFRGGMALVLIGLGGLTFLLKKQNSNLIQYMSIAIALLVYFIFFLHYHFNEDPAFDIFLANILTVLIFIISTIMGMRFRYTVLINTINFIAYILYIENINYSVIAERQVSQLFVIYMVGILAAYILDRQKMTAFIHKNRLGLEVKKVDELNGLKNKLFSIISHDLRGPINSLKGTLSLYKKEALSKEEFKKLALNLEEDFNNSSNLLDNLLAWSKSQLQGLEIQKTTVNLKKGLSELQKLYSSQLKTKGISFKLEVAEEDVILADKETIHIVFRNILSNAIKFTNLGGKISIKSNRKSDGMMELLFIDSGTGIPPEKLKQLFQINKETLIGTSAASGAGIGLVLVKEFLELNDGFVEVESILGKGTTFKVMLPSA